MTTEHNPPAADPNVIPGPASIVRSEEQLRIGTTTQIRERVRLRKRVVTEEVTQTVTVSREVLDVERLPGDASPLTGGTEWSAPPEFDIVLHEERVVVTTQIVPVERVRVWVEQVSEQVQVSDVVRREEIAVEQAGRVRG